MAKQKGLFVRFQILEKRIVELRRSARLHVEKCRRDGLCLACGQPFIEGEKVRREMHIRCYDATWRAVRDGKTTWEERVKNGRAGEAKSPGRPPSNPVTIEVA